jgi:hypothetical protein
MTVWRAYRGEGGAYGSLSEGGGVPARRKNCMRSINDDTMYPAHAQKKANIPVFLVSETSERLNHDTLKTISKP